jgi:hypothetical protein
MKSMMRVHVSDQLNGVNVMGKHGLALLLIIVLAASASIIFAQKKQESLAGGVAGGPEISTQANAMITSINLKGNDVFITGNGATVSGNKVIISSAGTYSISGMLLDGQILVNTAKGASVEIILNGAAITCSNSSPLYIENSKKTKIVLADNSKNYLSDGSVYAANKTKKNEPNAALFSRDDLTISGNGSLEVKGNYNDGIASKDKLTITGGTISVNSADDGIKGKDYVNIKGGNITIAAKGDGLKSAKEDDSTAETALMMDGKIVISGGKINITSEKGDAIQAASYIDIEGGEFVLTTGAGAQSVSRAASLKAISAGDNLVIGGGTFVINSSDDALRSNNTLTINGGTFDIATGNNGIIGDSTVEINNGDIRISQSYEGLEGSVVKINSGKVHINSNDDGISIRSSRKGYGTSSRRRSGSRSSNYLYVNGGYTVVNAYGDGIDVNGAVEMTGGTLLISGPLNSMNGPLDYDWSFKISGGLLIAAGSSGMAQVPYTGSTQNSVLVYFDTWQAEGTLFHVQSGDGGEVVSFAPPKAYSSVAFSSPKLINGTAYDVYSGGSSSGEAKDGLHEGGTYSPGTKYVSFTPSSVTTAVSSSRVWH